MLNSKVCTFHANKSKAIKILLSDDSKIESDLKIELAFDKKKAEDRKFWLKSYDKKNIIEQYFRLSKNSFY